VVGTCGGGPGLQKAPAFPLALMHARPLPGWGWVAISKWPVLLHAHPLEKSAPNFKDTSIHRLPYWQVNLRGVGAS